MALPLLVGKINATPAFPIGNRDESVSLRRNVSSEIWNSATPMGSNDGQFGSLKPVSFPWGKAITMSVEGLATYPQDWPAGALGNFAIIGSIQRGSGPKIDVLKGSWREEKLVDTPPRNAPVPLPFSVSLALVAPPDATSKDKTVPWGFAGDVEWRLVVENVSGKQLTALTKTRLELYQLASVAPGGPTEALSAQSTLANFQGKWPVYLLRLFMPSPTDLQGKAADIAANKISWWAKLISTKLSSYGVQYDALDGRSGYGVGLLGGSFDITSFYDKVDTTPNAFYDKTFLALNSFDMTSLVQAAFEILLPSLDPAGGSMSWIGFAPGRKIADKTAFLMVPVGWQDDAVAAAGVSTPFYKGRLAANAEDGALATTAWLEMKAAYNSPAMIVQLAFKTKGGTETQWRPDVADIERADFMTRHFLSPAPTSDPGRYYDSDSIAPVTKADKVGDDLGRRVGVYNLRGVNEPWPWRYESAMGKPSILALPPSVRTIIGNVLQLPGVKNTDPTARRADLVNAGSLRPSRIYSLVKSQPPQKVLYNGNTDYFRLVVGRGVAVATYIVPLARTGAYAATKTRVKISTFERFSDALEGLVSLLSGFESNIAKVIKPNAPGTNCGQYVVQTTHSLLFVRNNLLVDLTVMDAATYTDAGVGAALLSLAVILDTEFVLNSVPRCHLRRAAFDIVDPAPPVIHPAAKVYIDKPFTMTISNVDLLAEELGVQAYSGQSSVGQPIIYTSAQAAAADVPGATSVRKLEFLPLQNDADSAEDVDIAVSGAHYDTFFPVTRITTVELQKKK